MGPAGVLQTIETKLEDAAEACGALWQTGQDFPQAFGEAREAIIGKTLRKVLNRQGAAKRKERADGPRRNWPFCRMAGLQPSGR